MDDTTLRDALDRLDANERLRYQANEAMRERARHCSQTALAREIGVSVPYVNDWMHGRREWPAHRLRKLHEHLAKG